MREGGSFAGKDNHKIRIFPQAHGIDSRVYAVCVGGENA
jgi:hypothetical protein